MVMVECDEDCGECGERGEVRRRKRDESGIPGIRLREG